MLKQSMTLSIAFVCCVLRLIPLPPIRRPLSQYQHSVCLTAATSIIVCTGNGATFKQFLWNFQFPPQRSQKGVGAFPAAIPPMTCLTSMGSPSTLEHRLSLRQGRTTYCYESYTRPRGKCRSDVPPQSVCSCEPNESNLSFETHLHDATI